jgi:alcohol sulfotransferase
VRKAKVGGYRDYFDDKQIQALNQLVTDRLDSIFGYEFTAESGNQTASA